jgi:anthranilate synthase/aminodeoxychorismate synthase-like glutamine amidotransferase
MTLLIDNYDSFTFNLKQELDALGADCRVVRNDALTLEEVARLRPGRLVISPGPGRPDAAGISLGAIRRFAGELPILGVCLGHQALGQAFGARVVRARRPRHGKLSAIRHGGQGLFTGIPDGFAAVRYHSLVIEPTSLPDALVVEARSDEGEIMALRHRALPLFGVQFHPESVATEQGCRLLANFLAVRARREAA